MANIGVWAQRNALDWLCLGATPTRVSTVGVALSLGAPGSSAASEIGPSSGYTPQTVSFCAAVTTNAGSGTVTNVSAMTFGPFSTAQSISGLVVKDTLVSSGTGNIVFYGTLTTARTVSIGDSLVIAAGALAITLS